MRDPERIKPLLKLIEDIWTTEPDLRLCQLLWNATTRISFSSDDLFNLEDDDLFIGLKRLYASNQLKRIKRGEIKIGEK